MKSLFTEDRRHTYDASKLEGDAYKELKIIFLNYIEKGFNPIEIAHIIHGTISELESLSILELRRNLSFKSNIKQSEEKTIEQNADLMVEEFDGKRHLPIFKDTADPNANSVLDSKI